ncbi:16762_t:CDS:2 [Funneliformis mosseae]|uniref:16762_t:CDS:1 n=1 Tax=Funneliformis mosseae TaxID=27381 RepID=A0A9N8YKC3_FUNMO|nr:16762_t:CDS:2 [Funneliformis mosseae]
MKINLEGLQTWYKTRWSSLYMTTDSILRARPVFDWILLEHRNIITNSDVYNLMQNEKFFTSCYQIRSIWASIQECINILEARSASLADYFIQMIKLAVSIFQLPSSNPYKTNAIQIFNYRYLEFQHPAYLLYYYLHPYYRGMGLRNEAFKEAAIAASTLWQNLASSEQNFSILKWMIGDRRTRLGVKKLESMAKIRSYYLTNIKNELSFYGKELNEAELREVVNISTVGEVMILDEDKQDEYDDADDLILEKQNTTLILEEIVDFTQPLQPFFNNNIESDVYVDGNNVGEREVGNMDFDPTSLVDQILDII